jgi:hypothetical protein
MKEIVRTSEKTWLEKALRHYRDRTRFRLVDDAEVGITEKDVASGVALIKAASRDKLGWRKIAQVLVGFGLSGAGVAMVILAVLDPEPTSKLSLLIAGGVILALTGGVAMLRALGQTWKVRVHRGGTTFEVEPQDSKEKRVE